MMGMTQITIKINNEKIQEDYEKFFNFLREKLYPEVLRRDNLWHFFFEGERIFLRLDTLRKEMAEKALVEAGFELTAIMNYEENIDITKKYIKEFVKIFNGYSVLAVACEDEEVLPIFDRVFHCILNMFEERDYINCILRSEFVNGPKFPMIKENFLLSIIGAIRSSTIGFYLGQIEQQNQE